MEDQRGRRKRSKRELPAVELNEWAVGIWRTPSTAIDSLVGGTGFEPVTPAV